MNKEKFIELVTKHLTNEALPDEQAQLNSLLKHEEYREQYDLICSKWKGFEDTMDYEQFDVQRGYEKLTAKIRKYEPGYTIGRKKGAFKEIVYNNTFLKVAVSIVFLLILGTGMFYILGIFERSETISAWKEKVTVPGQKSILTLFDGTKITLNADSKLKYPPHFGSIKREVYLEGEAYFEVANNYGKPFIVHSGDVSTIVLGTKFDVKAFLKENEIAVSLVEGRVRVTKNNNVETILDPSQQLLYDKITGTEQLNTFDYLQTIGWKDNIFIFDNEPLEKVLIQLERSFGVKFELLDKSFNNLKIKANFENESFWTIVKVIKTATGLEYKAVSKNNELERIIFFKNYLKGGAR